MTELADLGECAWTAIDVEPILVDGVYRGRIRRRDLAARALVMRSRGALQREIAAALGVSRSYASSLTGRDPLGDKDRERKQRYAGTCEVCGDPTSGSNGRDLAPTLCERCSHQRQHDERFWTRERILDGMRTANEISLRVLGRPIRAADWLCLTPSQRGKFTPTRLRETRLLWAVIRHEGVRVPVMTSITTEFGSWGAAAVEIGVVSPRGGHPHHREPRSRPKLHLVEQIRHPDAEEVCPACGDFVKKLVTDTGWCRRCTRAARSA